MDFSGRETVLSGKMREADQSMHQGQLSGMVELKAWNSFSVGKNRRLYQCLYLPSVDEGFQDVLLDIVIPVDDG